MSITFPQLRCDMTNAAQLTFSVYQRHRPDEDFYAYALFTDSDASGANAAANTEQSFERAAKDYLDGDWTLAELGHLRYIPDAWPYSGVARWPSVSS